LLVDRLITIESAEPRSVELSRRGAAEQAKKEVTR